MQYSQLGYVPEADDPSLTLETSRLVAKIIDNTGLLTRQVESKSYFNETHAFVPFSHHLGYHGIRTLYDKTEKRNIVAGLNSWLNLQQVQFAGIENDPVDERAWAGVGRGWPVMMEARGKGAILRIGPLPQTRFRYSLELQPAEPDAIDFSVRFEFGGRPSSGQPRFRASWPCYMNAYDDVRLFYPRGTTGDWQWTALGEKPDIIIGETVGYRHQQQAFFAENQALPLGYGPIGEYALTIMFSDPKVRLFVVNAGGHFFISPVQNPAWDFEWIMEDYPLDTPVGFDGRIIYAPFQGPEGILGRYMAWNGQANHDSSSQGR